MCCWFGIPRGASAPVSIWHNLSHATWKITKAATKADPLFQVTIDTRIYNQNHKVHLKEQKPSPPFVYSGGMHLGHVERISGHLPRARTLFPLGNLFAFGGVGIRQKRSAELSCRLYQEANVTQPLVFACAWMCHMTGFHKGDHFR